MESFGNGGRLGKKLVFLGALTEDEKSGKLGMCVRCLPVRYHPSSSVYKQYRKKDIFCICTVLKYWRINSCVCVCFACLVWSAYKHWTMMKVTTVLERGMDDMRILCSSPSMLLEQVIYGNQVSTTIFNFQSISKRLRYLLHIHASQYKEEGSRQDLGFNVLG